MRDNCPACGSTTITEFYEAGRVPAHSCLMFSSRDEALAFPRGDVRLAYCRACGFIFNRAFLAEHKKYDVQYEDQQIFSPTFTAFARQAVLKLIDKYGLRGKSITEIGCGKADFLSLICEMGNNRGVGIDPTAREDRLSAAVRDRITLVPEYFSESHAKLIGDAVICRHTLEHIDEPYEFLKTLRRAMDGKPETAVFFDIPDSRRILRENAFWDVYYEHCSYFTEHSARRLFTSCGFSVCAIEYDFDGQWLCIEAKPIGEKSQSAAQAPAVDGSVADDVERFGRDVKTYVRDWQELFKDWQKKGTRFAIWGSGSKCVAFLTTLGIENPLQIIDINPHRQGKYMPGVQSMVEAPEALIKGKPEVVVVMNPIYVDEIKAKLDQMGVRADIIAVGKDA